MSSYIGVVKQDVQFNATSKDLSVDGNISVTGTVDGADIAANNTKLAGIEANADVTDATNVVAAGAAMLSGATFTGDITLSGDNYNVVWDKSDDALEFVDSAKAVFGTGNDLQIFHTNNNSVIREDNSQPLYIQTDNTVHGVLMTKDNATEVMAKFKADGPVELYHDNSKKFETASGGIDVTGNIVVSGTVDGRDLATDGTKLDGIEASADVTDATNVAAAGALMANISGSQRYVFNNLNGNSKFAIEASSTGGSGAGGAFLKFKGSNGTPVDIAAIDGSMTNGTAGSESGILSFRTTDSGTSSERMRIAADGTVSISQKSSGNVLEIATHIGAYEIALTGSTHANIIASNGANPFYIQNLGNGNMHFQTNSTDRIVINNSGNVGIGTSNPGSILDIENTGPSVHINDSNGVLSGAITSRILFQASGSNHGIVGFGSSVGNMAVTNTQGHLYLQADTSGVHSASKIFLTVDNTERLNINSSGTSTFTANNAGVISTFKNINSSNPDGIDVAFTGATPDNNSRYFYRGRDQAVNRFYVYSDGDVQNHDNTYTATSDIKLKEQISDASSQWDDIKALQVRKYKMKSDVSLKGDSDELWRIGVIAQEVESAGMTGLVKNNPDYAPEYFDEETQDWIAGEELDTVTKAVKYSILYMKAVKALQEAMTRIETLETEVTALKSRIGG